MKGVLRRYNRASGYGWVECDDGEEAFLHVSEVTDGVALRPGIRLEFDLERRDGYDQFACVNVCGTGRDSGARKMPDGPQRGWIRKIAPDGSDGYFGWIKPESGGRTLFFRASRSQLGNGKSVAGGLPVAFELARGRDDRIEAINVRQILPEHQTQEEARIAE